MHRASFQPLIRSSASAIPRRAFRPSQRLLSTSPPHERSRSWKSSAVRYGLAAAVIYWYNTTTIFADSPQYHAQPPSSFPTTEQEDENERLHTIDELRAARKAKQASAAAAPQSGNATADADADTAAAPAAAGVEGLEEEAEGEGAFNPETGEINWDCPCLGGMAHGPCGTEFREAFSCFVYSKEEPKGMDCVDKFRGMQDCFRQHPDIYGEELADDDEDDPQRVPLDEPAPGEARPGEAAAVAKERSDAPVSSEKSRAAPESRTTSPHSPSSEKIRKEEALPESEELVPRAWHDERGAKPPSETKSSS